ncbi:hypothetical protein [Seonamhaeicola sp. ML3]|uniref:hypothetical protein n=1 Tax=Seonamhaeicola sp. ML3 TaxID=2937786 RepID=UPI00200E39B9|nr:hypothetical protein [Seonamhaeicola sp. ML3]
MKNYAHLLLTAFLILASCNSKDKTSNTLPETNENENEYTLEGVWEIESYINYREGKADTIWPSDERKQRKMFSKHKVMWSKLRTFDSLDWFGVGDYTLKDGIFTEVLDYGSKPVNKIIETSNKWSFNAVVTEDSFTQIMVDSLGNYIYAENYTKVD